MSINLDQLTPAQREAVLHRDGHAIVIASPGSGKCVVGDTMVLTDQGLLQIDQLKNVYELDNNCMSAHVSAFSVQNKKWIIAKTSHWFDLEESPTIKITTSSGLTIQGTPEHPVLIMGKDGRLAFKKLAYMEKGDYCAIATGTGLWGSYPLDCDVAYLLGLLVGDGYLAQRGTISLCRNDPRIVDDYKRIIKEKLGNYKVVSYYRDKRKNGGSVSHTTSSVSLWLRLQNDYGLSCTKSARKSVPTSVLRATKDAVVAFLRGLFDTDASVGIGNFEWTTASRLLARQVQLLLLNLGIRSSVHIKRVKRYPENDYVRLSVSGLAAAKANEVGLFKNQQEKINALARIADKKRNSNVEVIPFQQDRIAELLHKLRKHRFYNGGKQALFVDGRWVGFRRYCTHGKDSRNVTANTVDIFTRYADRHDPSVIFLQTMAREFLFDPVVAVESGGTRRVYDFTVPELHNFVANGFVNHNTRVITHRIVQLVEDGANPASVVSVTFTNKAAKEMRNRINRMLPEDVAKRLLISTFHAMCARLLRIEFAPAGLNQNYIISDEDDATALVTDAICYLTKRDPKEVKRDQSYQGSRYCRRYISNLKQNLTTPEDLFKRASDAGREDDKESFLRRVYERYSFLLTRSNCVDFDDLIMKTVLLFRGHPDVQAKYSRRVRYLQVDEYQDTNLSQYELSTRLSSEWGNLFVVGDPRQSIYAFRGADYTNVLKFQDQFKDDIKVYFLKENFRSTKRIAAAANQLIKQNKGHDTTEIVAVHHEGVAVRVVAASHGSQEADFAVNEINQMVTSGDAHYRDFAIIYRVHAKSRRYEELLVASGIPHQVIGGVGFYARAVIKDVLAYLRLILNPQDDASFMRIYDSPPRGFGDASYSKLYEQKEKHQESLVEAILNNRYADTGDKRGQTGANKLRNVFQQLSKLDLTKMGPLVEQVLAITGYQEHVEKSSAGENKMQDLQLLEELSTACHGFDERSDNAGLVRFLEWVALMQGDEKKEEDPDKVSLMTCHAAKGLEFKYVYLVGATDGAMPIVRTEDDDGMLKSEARMIADLEEERRVCYVGMTRAEEGLTITYGRCTLVRGNVVSCTPSRFIDEMADTLELVQLDPDQEGYASQHESKRGNALGRYFQGQQHGRQAFRSRHQRKSYRSKF